MCKCIFTIKQFAFHCQVQLQLPNFSQDALDSTHCDHTHCSRQGPFCH